MDQSTVSDIDGKYDTDVELEARAWSDAAADLAERLRPLLLNRDDAWGAYRRVWGEVGLRAYTAHADAAVGVVLDVDRFTRHFRATTGEHVIGLHAASTVGTCRWGGIDLDVHDDRGNGQANLMAALAWRERLVQLGFSPWLSESNGRGGYHLRVVVAEPVAMALMHTLLSRLVSDFAQHGLQQAPELFPARPMPTGQGYGKWLRLPGRHHTRPHWSRFFDDGRWIAGEAAVRYLLQYQPDPADLVPIIKPPERPARPHVQAVRIGADDDRDRAVALQCLAAIGNDDLPYDEWLKVGMALHAVDDGEQMLDEWIEWSARSVKHDERTCRAKWSSFRRDASGGVGLGTLVRMARQGGIEPVGRLPRDPLMPATHAGSAERLLVLVTADEHEAIQAVLDGLPHIPDLYVYGRTLARVIRPSAFDGVARPHILPLTATTIRPMLSERFRFARPRAAHHVVGGPTPIAPPEILCRVIVDRGEWPNVRSIAGVTTTPYLLPDGSVVTTAGYDERSRLLLVPDSDYARLPERPNLEDARQAIEMLLDVVVDFPFATEGDRSAWLAGALTPFARQAFSGPTPLFLVTGNAPGAGKTKLVNLISLICAGVPMLPIQYGPPEELRKAVTALLQSGARTACFDNLDGNFGDPILNQLLTSDRWSDRILGRTEITDLPNRMMFFANGNNVQVAGDLQRRVIPIRLRTDEERPEERRDFRYSDLEGHVTEHRPQLVAACLTVLSAYLRSGRPDVGSLPMFGSFNGWSALVRAALVWAGQPDPLVTRQLLVEVPDPEREVAEQVLAALVAAYPNGATFTATDVIARMIHQTPLGSALTNALQLWLSTPSSGKSPALELGRRLRNLRESVHRGLRVETCGRSSQGMLWRVITLK